MWRVYEPVNSCHYLLHQPKIKRHNHFDFLQIFLFSCTLLLIPLLLSLNFKNCIHLSHPFICPCQSIYLRERMNPFSEQYTISITESLTSIVIQLIAVFLSSRSSRWVWDGSTFKCSGISS